VMVWDKGTYKPEDDVPPNEQLARGKINVLLHGKKLRGGFTLLRAGKGLTDSSRKQRWLLIKQRDGYADDSWDIERPELDGSVLTGRTLNEIEQERPGKKRRMV